MLKGVSRRGIVAGAWRHWLRSRSCPRSRGGGDRTVESQPFTAAGDDTTTALAKCADESSADRRRPRDHTATPRPTSTRGSRRSFQRATESGTSPPTASFRTNTTRRTTRSAGRATSSRRVSEDEAIDGGVTQINDVTAKCPKGSSVTGGGGATTGATTRCSSSSRDPEGDRSWFLRTFAADVTMASTRHSRSAIPRSPNKYETVSKTSTTPATSRAAPRGITYRGKGQRQVPQGLGDDRRRLRHRRTTRTAP